MQYYYDKEADVFYFSEGAPRVSDETIEVGNDVLIRQSPRTKKIRGFTILNASRRSQNELHPVALPFTFAALTN